MEKGTDTSKGMWAHEFVIYKYIIDKWCVSNPRLASLISASSTFTKPSSLEYVNKCACLTFFLPHYMRILTSQKKTISPGDMPTPLPTKHHPDTGGLLLYRQQCQSWYLHDDLYNIGQHTITMWYKPQTQRQGTQERWPQALEVISLWRWYIWQGVLSVQTIWDMEDIWYSGGPPVD